MTKQRIASIVVGVCLSLAAQSASAQVQWPPPVSDPLEHERPPIAAERTRPDAQRLAIRYRRLRAVGALLTAFYLPIVLASAVPFARSSACAEGELCILEFSYGASVGMMSAMLSPVLAAGTMSLGMGVKRGRELQWQTPGLAVERHGARVVLAARF